MSEDTDRVIKMVEFDLDLEDYVVEFLLKYAKDNIVNDNKALVNWAASDILSKQLATEGAEDGE